jgi:hypothetical protein
MIHDGGESDDADCGRRLEAVEFAAPSGSIGSIVGGYSNRSGTCRRAEYEARYDQQGL